MFTTIVDILAVSWLYQSLDQLEHGIKKRVTRSTRCVGSLMLCFCCEYRILSHPCETHTHTGATTTYSTNAEEKPFITGFASGFHNIEHTSSNLMKITKTTTMTTTAAAAATITANDTNKSLLWNIWKAGKTPTHNIIQYIFIWPEAISKYRTEVH